MKRLLVTGASGFLGSRIVEFYSGKYEIYAPTHAEMDITDGGSVCEAFDRFHPDFVIHSAAISDVTACEKEPEKSWRINLYGQEKKRAEEECLNQNPECVLLRLSWMYDIKTVNRQEHNDFFCTLISKLEASETLRYPIYDVRGITDVNEVVRNFEKALDLPGGIYNFGSPNDKNTYETALSMFQELKWDVSRLRRNEEAFASKPRNISMNLQKLNDNGIFFSSTLEALVRNGRRFQKETCFS